MRAGGAGHWHLDKRVSIGHLVTTAAVAVSVVLYITNIETRVVAMEQVARQNSERIARTEQRYERRNGEIIARLERLWDAVDDIRKLLTDGGQ